MASFDRIDHIRWELYVGDDWRATIPEGMGPVEFALAVLGALEPAEREVVIRQACREAGLRVLSGEQARLLLPALGEGDPPIGSARSGYADAVAAVRGEEVEDRG